MNPDNPIVKLCIAGTQAEMAGRPDEAADIYLTAWEQAHDDYEACIAAHYVARHQPDARACLDWNQISLARAETADPEAVAAFYPSLYLNLSQAHEALGQLKEAEHFYRLAESRAAALPSELGGELWRAGLAARQSRFKPQIGATGEPPAAPASWSDSAASDAADGSSDRRRAGKRSTPPDSPADD